MNDNDLGFSLLFAGFFAVVTIWQSWAWALLLPSFLVGMLLRRRLPRSRALLIGGGAALVMLAGNTGLIGAGLRTDPDFISGVYPAYFLGLVLALCWLLHTVLALLLLGAGCLLTEAVLRARAVPAPASSPRRGTRQPPPRRR